MQQMEFRRAIFVGITIKKEGLKKFVSGKESSETWQKRLSLSVENLYTKFLQERFQAHWMLLRKIIIKIEDWNHAMMINQRNEILEKLGLYKSIEIN